VLNYFAGANDQQRDISAAKTAPFAVIPPAASSGTGTYVAHLQVSPAQFPDDFLIPRPNPNTGVALSRVSDNLELVASFAFNTTGFPYLENFQEACGVIRNETLPKGYAINTTSLCSPAYVFYNGQAAVNFTSECWWSVLQTST